MFPSWFSLSRTSSPSSIASTFSVNSKALSLFRSNYLLDAFRPCYSNYVLTTREYVNIRNRELHPNGEDLNEVDCISTSWNNSAGVSVYASRTL